MSHRLHSVLIASAAALFLAACGASDTTSIKDDSPKPPNVSGKPAQELNLGAPDFDIRGVIDTTLATPRIALPAARQRVLDQLRGAAPGDLVVRYSELTDSPSRLNRLGPPLTRPNSAPQKQIASDFLKRFGAIFNVSDADLTSSYFSRDFTSKHNGVRHLTVQFQVAGADVFGSLVTINVDGKGRVINASGQPIPKAADHINTEKPVLSEAEAIAAAARAAHVNNVASSSGMSLVYFPLSKTELRLAYSFMFQDGDSPNLYDSIVDAVDGRLLWRKSLTHYNDIPAHGAVYTSDSPRPQTPQGTLAGTVARQDVPFTGGDFFPHDDPHFDWWAGSARTTTTSNNADAYADRNGDNSADSGSRPTAGTGEDFTFAVNLAQEPDTYQPAAVANLFYWNNRIHDFFYRYGFDEAAGNFQSNNLGLGGSGGDPVMAEAQDNADGDPRSLCNANMSTPGDGSSPRMQMFLCDSATPERDGDFDNVVIGHEYTHGVHTRLVPTTGAQRANEGWADYFGLALVAEADDPYGGSYGVGDYLFNGNGSGIRSFPYSTDTSVFRLSYASLNTNASCIVKTCSSDDTETCSDDDDCSTAGDTCDALACQFHEDCEPPNTTISQGPCRTQVHFAGSIWANTILLARFNMVGKYGFPAGHHGMNQLVIDGMKLSDDNPTFLDGRNKLLEADQVNFGGANQCLIWDAFAKMGMGFSASTTGVDDINPLEGYDVPPTCSPVIQVDAPSSFGKVCGGEPENQTLRIFNTGSGELIVTSVARVSGSADIKVNPEPTLPVFVGPDSHVDFTIVCAPSATGSTTATIRITSNDSQNPTKDIVYTCDRGLSDINLAIAGSGYFGAVCEKDHADLGVTLFNQGSCDLRINSISLIPATGSFELPADLRLPLVLSHDADFTLPVRFSPDFCSDSPENAIVRLTTNDPSRPTVDIDISGLSPCPELVIDPPALQGALAFPATVADASGRLGCFSERTVNLRNVGGCPLVIESVLAAGLSNGLDFSVIQPTRFPVTLPPGEETLGVTVRFTPQMDAAPLAPTEILGQLTVVSNDPVGAVIGDLCGEAVAGSGVRILVTEHGSPVPAPLGLVDRITIDSQGLSQPGPISLTFTNQPLSQSTVCGRLISYHVDQETLPATQTAGLSPGSSYQLGVKQGSLQTSAQFSLNTCEFKEIELQLAAQDSPGCVLLPDGAVCATDGECCSGMCQGPTGNKRCN